MSEIQLDYQQLSNTATRLSAHAEDLTTAATLISTRVGVIGLATATTAARDFQSEVTAMIDAVSLRVTTLSSDVQGSLTTNQDRDAAAATTFTGTEKAGSSDGDGTSSRRGSRGGGGRF